MGRKLGALVGGLALLVGIAYGFVWLGAETDALAAREYQEQQRLVARLAAERLADLVTEVELRLALLRPPASPATAPADWLSAAALEELGVTVFVHDEGGRVRAVPPGLPPDRAAALVGHRHGAGSGRCLCTVCLEEVRAVGLSRPLPGHPGLFLGAVIDPAHLHGRLFAARSGPHDAYVWVMRSDRTIVSAPDPTLVGTRPFTDLPPAVEASIEPVLSAMAAGEAGASAYVWRDGASTRERLVAFTPVPGWPDLSVAYSADRASVTARTAALSRAGTWVMALLMGAFVALLGAIAFVYRGKLHVERRARRELAAAQERMLRMERLSTIGQLTASIGHEMRNPLAFIRANLEALRMLLDQAGDGGPVEPGRLRAEADEILAEMDLGVERITDILAALGGVGRTHQAPRPLDLRQPLATALLLARPHLARRVRLSEEVDEPLPVRGVAGELVQVLLNLLVNGAQACSAGGRVGHLTLTGDVAGGWARLTVRDDGPGIPPEVRDRIFEPFFTTKPEGEGTGLGLPICREIAERHGGRLTFETGSWGTAFTLELPVAEAGAGRPEAAPQVAAAP